eukprot:scaffold92907_cov63-Phaeocystis_antarctica.AAC.9
MIRRAPAKALSIITIIILYSPGGLGASSPGAAGEGGIGGSCIQQPSHELPSSQNVPSSEQVTAPNSSHALQVCLRHLCPQATGHASGIGGGPGGGGVTGGGMNTCIGGGVGGAVIVDGADGGGRGVARHSDVSIARPAARRLCPCLVPARAREGAAARRCRYETRTNPASLGVEHTDRARMSPTSVHPFAVRLAPSEGR